ncbi:TetR/AcrR family transcriptional regulator [Geodermatophilus sp. SYSU D00697]
MGEGLERSIGSGPPGRGSEGEGAVTSARGRRRRDQIVAAATHLFRDKGFAGTTMDDIGRLAGVTGPALYHHFATKQQVLAATMWQLGDDINAGLEQVTRSNLTPWERNEALVRHLVQVVRRQGEAYSLVFVEDRNLTEEDLAITHQRRRYFVDALARSVREVRPDLSLEQAGTVASSIHVLAGAHTLMPPQVDGDELEELVVEMALALVRGTRVPSVAGPGTVALDHRSHAE